MKLPKFSYFRTQLSSGLQHIVRNRDGVSALEFALVAPFMLLVFFGIAELSLLMQGKRGATSAASTMGDIAARSASITDDDMADIFGSTNVVLQSGGGGQAGMRVSSLIANSQGDVTVAWSDARNMAPLSQGSSVADLPEGVVQPNGSIIMSELQYTYEPQVGYFIRDDVQLSERFFLRPRRVDQVARDRDN
ncbi:MAG: TadE/TadG family type IV pilus assembly protein [Pseudomonadota bacterium]